MIVIGQLWRQCVRRTKVKPFQLHTSTKPLKTLLMGAVCKDLSRCGSF